MPGTRHAKNNTALGFFTRYEKNKLGWGSRQKRLAKDSVKKFDACTICLKVCESPMICPSGDLFCKQCIFQSLLLQKQRNKEKLRDFKIQETVENRKLVTEQKRAEVDKFMKLDTIQSMSTKSNPTQTMGTEDIHTRNNMNKTPFDTTPNSNILPSNHSVHSNQRNINTNNATKNYLNSFDESDKKLSCFWVPQLTPNVEHTKLKRPDMHTYCPGCNKPLKLKKLTACAFTLAVNDNISIQKMIKNSNNNNSNTSSKKHNKPKTVKLKYNQRFMCGSCQKTLTNSMHCACLTRCGHIICVICLQKFVAKTKSCVICDEPCKKKKHVIILASGGTGFAGHGNTLQATRKNVAFQ